MNKEDFVNNSVDILTQLGLSKEQANAITQLTIQLEKSNYEQNKSYTE